MFTVIDTGIGIEKAQAEHIFDEFYQVEPGGNAGFGLGLAICKRAAGLMDGYISLESEPGRGSRFKLVLTLRPGPAITGDIPVLQERADTHALRILVADDNQINRTLLSGFCESLGALCTCVDDGEQAVEEYRSGKYDTVVLDLHMHVKDGLQTAREIRQFAARSSLQPPLIVAVTADDAFVAGFDAAESPFDRALLKPFSLHEFSHAIILVRNSQ
jgi:CheY-like chemotaxis protein